MNELYTVLHCALLFLDGLLRADCSINYFFAIKDVMFFSLLSIIVRKCDTYFIKRMVKKKKKSSCTYLICTFRAANMQDTCVGSVAEFCATELKVPDICPLYTYTCQYQYVFILCIIYLL